MERNGAAIDGVPPRPRASIPLTLLAYGFGVLGVAINIWNAWSGAVTDMILPARMGVLAEGVMFFLPAWALTLPLARRLLAFSSVGFKVDFDMALLVLASGLYRIMARRMRGYNDAQARQIFRDLIDMPADVAIAKNEITVRFYRRAHLPIVLASGLFDKPVPVPWWNGRSLRLIQ